MPEDDLTLASLLLGEMAPHAEGRQPYASFPEAVKEAEAGKQPYLLFMEAIKEAEAGKEPFVGFIGAVKEAEGQDLVHLLNGVPFNGMDPEAARRAEIRAMNTARQQQDARYAHQVAQDRRERLHKPSSSMRLRRLLPHSVQTDEAKSNGAITFHEQAVG